MEVQTSFIFVQMSKFSKSPSIHFGRSDAKIMLNLTHGTVYKNDRISETKKAMMLKFWMDIDIFMGHNQAYTIPYHTKCCPHSLSETHIQDISAGHDFIINFMYFRAKVQFINIVI